MTAFVVGAWLLVALAWTPATYLVERGSGGNSSLAFIFAFECLNFLPWILATPLVFWLSRRFPIGEPRRQRHVLIQAGIGVLLVPMLTMCGTLLAEIVTPSRASPLRSVTRVAITACYALPTYIAVAGVAQAFAYFGRYRTRERLLARAELRALEAQLNPHFLFNALNAISALGYRDPALADRALSRLSELLRSALTPRAQEVPLRDEIGFVGGYLDLCSLIMPGQVFYELMVDPVGWEAAVPAMLLQPLVENAIEHGIAKLRDGGRVSVAASVVAGRLRIIVNNDVPTSRTGASPGTGIGLSNLEERLRVLYGEDARLTLENTAPQVRVVVDLPYRTVLH